jgi:hypothetical protein
VLYDLLQLPVTRSVSLRLSVADVCPRIEVGASLAGEPEEALALSVEETNSVSVAVFVTPVVELVAEVERVWTGQLVAVLDRSGWSDLLSRLVAAQPLVVVLHEECVVLVAVWNQTFGDSKLLAVVASFEVEAARVRAVKLSCFFPVTIIHKARMLLRSLDSAA